MINLKDALTYICAMSILLIGSWMDLSAQSQSLSLSFNHLQVRDGLSEGTNAWVYRDSFGFVWISSLDGLNRFDGSTVKVYKANPADSTSLNDNIITSTFFEDDENNLWFTSYNAIHKYVRKYDHFEVYTLKDTSGNLISEDYLGFHLHDGKFWVKTGVRDDGLLHLFDINSKVDSIASPLQGYRQSVMENKDGEPIAVVSSFLFGAPGIRILPLTNEVVFRRQDYFSSGALDQYPSSLIQQVEIISPEEMWMSSPLGLIQLNPVSGDFTIFTEAVNGSLGRVSSTSAYKNLLFVATANNGLHLFDRKKRTFLNQYLPSQNLDFQLRKKDISMITVDDYGCLWVSYYEDLKPYGLDFSELYINRFPKFSPKTGGPNYVTAIANINGDILINDFNYLAHMESPENILKTWTFDEQVVQLFVDSKDRVWIVTKRSSIVETNFYLLEDLKEEPVLIGRSKLDIQDFLELSDGSIIVSTYGQGVQRLIEDDQGIHFERDDRFPEMKGSLVFKMYQDNYDNIYLAVNFNRLEVYKLTDDKITFVKTIDNVGNCKDFYDNPMDTSVWIASANGILRLDPTSYAQHYLDETDGLPPFKLYSITKDKNGLFWLKTERGLLKYDPIKEKSVQFGVVDGIRPIIGNTHPSIITDEGVIWMAGQDGLNVFHPDSIQTLRSPPTPQIIQISINEAPYQTSFSYSAIDSLKLSYNENTVAFDFVPCQYSDPNNVKFQYRLIGYNDEWVESKGSGFARYFSLPPGQYTFEARTGNSENTWSEYPASISVTIHPPWWATTWAYIFYGLTFITTVFLIRRAEKRKQRLKLLQERRKVAQEKKINEELRKVDRLKDQFLANTSHELRTPLNGIIGLAESLVDGATGNLPSKTIKNLRMIASSGKRLSNLVNDILDFSRLRSDDLLLDKKPVDLFTAVDVVTTLLQPLRKDTSIKMKNEVERDLPLLHADENRLQQILYNILGNAIKFTHQGHIRVYATSSEDDFIKVSIEDTGIGIPEEDFDRVFRTFEQVDGSTERRYEGTGLGLSVTRKLVELHGGEISLKSKVGEGSTFTFSLPISKADRSSINIQKPSDYISEVDQDHEIVPVDSESKITPSKDAHRILIVDDEPVNRTVLENHLLTAGYASAQAKDGQTALQMLEEEKYDMVLLDIMMPGMSGYEVCREIRKTNPAISLPIIMLTAKNRVNDLVEGFLVGANDYIAKPFSKDELLARIHTHLNLMSIYSATGRFVPYEFLNAIGHDEITQVKRGDHTETEVTVLFADIREFTRLSESMTPTENFQFVNTFVGRMGPVIQKNRGFVNQYLGDGIMAIFPHRSQDAIDAAWQMLKELEDFNSLLITQGKEAIRIGIGLHTGPLIMGIIGDENRTDPATIADAVNTSSRLEGLTKYYKAPVIVSEVSLEQYTGHDPSQFRFLGKVKLKGKKQVIGIYECITGDSEEVKAYKVRTASKYAKAIEAYQNGDLDASLGYFKELLNEGFDDAVVERFIDRIETLLEGDLPPDWQAVEVMTKK